MARQAITKALLRNRHIGRPPAICAPLPLPASARRDALAAARMLNRTLLLPRLWCWCDFDESPDVLETCRIKCVAPLRLLRTLGLLRLPCPLDLFTGCPVSC
jgi:hypothetical protein